MECCLNSPLTIIIQASLAVLGVIGVLLALVAMGDSPSRIPIAVFCGLIAIFNTLCFMPTAIGRLRTPHTCERYGRNICYC